MPSSTTNDADLQIRFHVIGAAPLLADCTVREIRPGEWLALGTVHHATGRHETPATIVVGQGTSDVEALAQIERELQTTGLNQSR